MTLPDRRRLHLVTEAADHLARAENHLRVVTDGTTVMDRIRQSTAGLPAQRFDGSRTHTGPVPDPTGDAAVRAADRQTDRASALLVELDRLVVRAHLAAERIVDILAAFEPAHVADPVDQREVEAANTTATGCQSCARVRDSKGRPTWSPLDSRRKGPTTVGGRLGQPAWLCSWCADWIETTGRAPTEAELAAHHGGRRVAWPADVPRPA